MPELPIKYTNRASMLGLGWSQVACRKCSEPVLWMWCSGDDPWSMVAVFVCKTCGHISPMCVVTMEQPMVRVPDS
jgi:hypothetical protein